MKMAMKDGKIYIKEADVTQQAVIKSWGRMRWNRGTQLFEGQCSMDLLERLAKLVRLPAPVEAERQKMLSVQNAVNAVRTDPAPKPLVRFPVKMNLYQHQVRAADMALIVFGMIPPDKVLKGGA